MPPGTALGHAKLNSTLSTDSLFHIGMTCLYGIYMLLCNIQCRDGVIGASHIFNQLFRCYQGEQAVRAGAGPDGLSCKT